MDDFQKQQAERDHLYVPAAKGHAEADYFITRGFPTVAENTRRAAVRVDMFTFRD